MYQVAFTDRLKSQAYYYFLASCYRMSDYTINSFDFNVSKNILTEKYKVSNLFVKSGLDKFKKLYVFKYW